MFTGPGMGNRIVQLATVGWVAVLVTGIYENVNTSAPLLRGASRLSRLDKRDGEVRY